MMVTRLLGPAALIAALAGCSTAPIALSPALGETAETLQIAGMGYGETGDFTLGRSSGTFVRHALNADERAPFGRERLTSYFGDGRFSVRGSDFDGVVEGDCSYLEAEASRAGLTLTTVPFHYRCSFSRDGRALDAQLMLHSALRAVGPLMAETRIGELDVSGRRIGIEPIHHSPGLRIPTQDPLGYRFVAEGREIGAVDLNGERKTIYAPPAGPDRETVLIASLALSVLWRS